MFIDAVRTSSRKSLLVLPLQSIIYSAMFLLVILLTLACIDRLLLPYLARRGDIGSLEWSTHNNRVNEFIGQRNLADKENPVWRSSSFPVSTNSGGKRRILVMGDSYVWGDGQANLNDIWWRQLQLVLEKRGYKNVEVIGAGRCGASTRQELNWAKKLVQIYKPELVVFGYVLNDPDEGSDTAGEGYVKQLKAAPVDDVFNKYFSGFEILFPNLAYQLKTLREKKLSERVSGGSNGYIYNVWLEKILEGKNFQCYSDTVKNLAAFAKNAGIPCFAISLPMPIPEDQSKYAPVEKLFKASGMPFVNLLDPMLHWYKNGAHSKIAALAVNPVNGHPGLLANRFYAEQTADLIEKDYSSVLGQKSLNSGIGKVDSIDINDFAPPIIALCRPKTKIFVLYYPTDQNLFLLMPLGRPYVQLNLSHPHRFKEIHLVGKSLTASSLAVRTVDPSNGEVVIQELGRKRGTGCIFNLSEGLRKLPVDELLITAQLDSLKDNKILVEFVD